MKEKVDLSVFYPYPPERVWQALTEASALRHWLMPSDFKPILGFRFRFEGLKRGGKSIVQGTVLEIEALKKLVYSWDEGDDEAPGIVSWTLHPTDGGTQVRLEHEPVAASQPYVLIEASLNWRHALAFPLPQYLRQRPPTPIVYVQEESDVEGMPKRRAGFRQEEAPCR